MDPDAAMSAVVVRSRANRVCVGGVHDAATVPRHPRGAGFEYQPVFMCLSLSEPRFTQPVTLASYLASGWSKGPSRASRPAAPRGAPAGLLGPLGGARRGLGGHRSAHDPRPPETHSEAVEAGRGPRTPATSARLGGGRCVSRTRSRRVQPARTDIAAVGGAAPRPAPPSKECVRRDANSRDRREAGYTVRRGTNYRLPYSLRGQRPQPRPFRQNNVGQGVCPLSWVVLSRTD